MEIFELGERLVLIFAGFAVLVATGLGCLVAMLIAWRVDNGRLRGKLAEQSNVVVLADVRRAADPAAGRFVGFLREKGQA